VGALADTSTILGLPCGSKCVRDIGSVRKFLQNYAKIGSPRMAF
jgi:hypothetical protein